MPHARRQYVYCREIFSGSRKTAILPLDMQVLRDHDENVGVFTRDFRHDEDTARILITVPACLEILLFSSTPAHRRWVKRLQYVIFDEVHCMREGGIKESGANESTGAIWEHCLLMIR